MGDIIDVLPNSMSDFFCCRRLHAINANPRKYEHNSEAYTTARKLWWFITGVFLYKWKSLKHDDVQQRCSFT